MDEKRAEANTQGGDMPVVARASPWAGGVDVGL